MASIPGPLEKPRPASRPAQPFARPLETLLTIKQAAALLQVSEKTIRRRIEEGGLVAHRIGARLRIAPRDVADYLRDRRVP
jgi:excisionase family DNA binding protein